MRSTEKNNQIAAELLGQTHKPIATGDHQPDQATIADTLAEGSVMAIFCHGCGYTQGADQTGLDLIVEETELELPTDKSGIFIAVDRCNLCDDDLINLRFEKI